MQIGAARGAARVCRLFLMPLYACVMRNVYIHNPDELMCILIALTRDEWREVTNAPFLDLYIRAQITHWFVPFLFPGGEWQYNLISTEEGAEMRLFLCPSYDKNQEKPL